MKLKNNLLSVLAVFCLISFSISAQDTDSEKKDIFTELSTPDSITGALVKFHQDKRIENLVYGKKNLSDIKETTINGYRVQVFSSNVQRTAKNEAFQIEKEIKEIYPDYGVYVNYTSPFWKVRVGDFHTYEQAQEFRAELVKAFPKYKSETYTVKDKVNVPSQN